MSTSKKHEFIPPLVFPNGSFRASADESQQTGSYWQQLEAQLHQAQKLETLGRLAGGIAHDFNNMLTVIMTCSDLVLRQIENESAIRGRVETIRNTANQAARLTRRLLSFSHQGLTLPSPINLNQLIEEMADLLPYLLSPNITLQLNLAPTPHWFLADPEEIRQVILNLVVNARDAMPHGGQLTIKTSHVAFDEADAPRPINPDHPAHYVQLTVTDTGCGMDADTQARIFEPFFTTKNKDKGTGLGLAIVHNVVRRCKGYIAVGSELGRGTTFHLYFPCLEEQA